MHHAAKANCPESIYFLTHPHPPLSLFVGRWRWLPREHIARLDVDSPFRISLADRISPTFIPLHEEEIWSVSRLPIRVLLSVRLSLTTNFRLPTHPHETYRKNDEPPRRSLGRRHLSLSRDCCRGSAVSASAACAVRLMVAESESVSCRLSRARVSSSGFTQP